MALPTAAPAAQCLLLTTCGAAASRRPPGVLADLVDARSPVRAPPVNGIIFVFPVGSTSMALIFAAG